MFKICQHVNEINKKYILEVNSEKQLYMRFMSFIFVLKMGKGKAVPLQAWIGPECSTEVKLPRFRDNGTGWW